MSRSNSLVVFWAGLFLAYVWPVGNVSAEASTAGLPDLDLKIDCPTRDILLGDEIPIVFTITNRGTTTYRFDDRDYDRSGRLHAYVLVAKDSQGRPVPDPFASLPTGIGGGLGSRQVFLAEGVSFTKTITLNLWVRINRPGRYTITGTFYGPAPDPVRARRMGGILVKSAPIEIRVKDRGWWAMDRYIAGIELKLRVVGQPRTDQAKEQREALVQKLMYTCDKRIVRTMLDLTYKNYAHNDVFWAGIALAAYVPKDQDVKRAVLTAVKTRGLAGNLEGVLEQLGCSEEEFREIIRLSLTSSDPNVVTEAAGAPQAHPADEHIPKLIAIVTDPNYTKPPLSDIARWRALYAIAFHRTDEGVALLKTLLSEPNRVLRHYAREAVSQGYHRHPAFPEEVDEEFTEILIRVAGDPNNPHRYGAVRLIAMSRDKTGREAVRALLKNPTSQIPLAETDRGVRTIRDLLRDADPDVRWSTGVFGGAPFREYPGRPLRPDDFPVEFQDTPEKRKAAALKWLIPSAPSGTEGLPEESSPAK